MIDDSELPNEYEYHGKTYRDLQELASDILADMDRDTWEDFGPGWFDRMLIGSLEG